PRPRLSRSDVSDRNLTPPGPFWTSENFDSGCGRFLTLIQYDACPAPTGCASALLAPPHISGCYYVSFHPPSLLLVAEAAQSPSQDLCLVSRSATRAFAEHVISLLYHLWG